MYYCYLKRCITALAVIACLLLQKSYAARTLLNSSSGVNRAPQSDTIKGSVVDGFNHKLPGVSVSVKGIPNTTTHTDNNGDFNIIAGIGNTLVLKAQGYDVKLYTVTTKQKITVRMLASYLQNPDTIDVLYGRVNADNYVGAVSSIYTNQITTTPATIFPYALAGRLNGLSTQQIAGYHSVNSAVNTVQNTLFTFGPSSNGSTAANDNSEIALSLRGQTPVTVIDGVQREFSSLDFEDIESITVLKDALSTILLGQLSSNGIVLVTTKKPQPGIPRISFTAQKGYQEPLSLPTPLSSAKYAYLYNEALENIGSSPVYTADDFNKYLNGSDPTGHPDVNWFDVLLKKSAPITKYNLMLNGGNTTASYVVSLGYLDQEGLFKDYNLEPYSTSTDFSRYTINSNINVNVTKNFNVALQIFGRVQDGNEPGATTSALLNGLYSTPNNAYPILNPNGSYGGNTNFGSNLFAQLTHSGYMQDYARDVMVNVDLTYHFDNWVKGLWFKAKGNATSGYTSITNRSKVAAVYERIVTPTDTVYNQYGTNASQINTYGITSNSQTSYAQLSFGYDHTFGKNTISEMIMADQRGVTVNFDLPGTYSNIAAKSSYNYAGKYFAEGALTYSGYDRYEPGKRFGFFYAGGLGWKISEEDFIKDNVSWINLLKLRTTFGKTGNANIGYFTYRPSFTDGNSYNFNNLGTGSVNGEKEQSPLTTSGATWEKADKLDIGIDFSALQNKLSFTFDYYHDRYYDLMETRGSSTAIIGNSYPKENIGINLYHGTEFSVTYRNNYNNFNYFITANASLDQSKVIYEDEIYRKYAINRRTGQPVDQVFGYVATGIIQNAAEAASSPTFDGYTLQPGDIKYKDINGDGKLTYDYDAVPIGPNKPHFFYGTTIGFSYQGFDFSVLLQGVGNRYIYIPFGFNQNQQAFVQIQDRWTPANTNAIYPRLTLGGNTNNTPGFVATTFFQRSGNYFRLKNMDIGYNLPYTWVRKIGISGLRIFANGLNLLTKAGYEYGDPEVGNGAYPIQRVFNTGVTIKL